MARYVDADALLSKYGEKHFYGEITTTEYYNLKIPLDYAPTADVVPTAFHDKCMQIEIEKRRNMVEVVHGKNIGGGAFECSVCGFRDNYHDYEVHFCPNCGARMDKGEENDGD